VDPGSLVIDEQGGIYAAGLGRISVSSDGGTTWRHMSVAGGNGLVVLPGEPGRFYSANPFQVSRSVDGGETWDTSVLPTPRCGARGIAVRPQEPRTVYLATRCGLQTSQDAGESWVDVLDAPYSTVLLHPTNPGVIYVGGSSDVAADPRGLWRSDDGGTTWARVNTDLPIRQLIFDPRDARHQTLVAESGHAYFWSSDGGASWIELGAPDDRPGFASTNQGLTVLGSRLLITWSGGVWETTLPRLP
jgi:photosystem II stability/assembly factor-like uncharacterized protein